MARKNVVTTQESPTGRNTRFYDPRTGNDMSRRDFVKQIENGKYEGYHIRKLNGLKTPVSNPDNSTNNNLG